MKKIGTLLAVLTGAVALAPSANAFSDCRTIADAMKRLACYDEAAGATAPSGKTAAVNLAKGAAANAMLTKAGAKPLTGPRFWFEADGGIYGFSRNSPILAAIAPPASTGPIAVPTSPGFIGLVTISTVTNPLATGDSAVSGAGGNYRMGYWLDPERTMAIDGSAFFVQGRSGSISQAPTTVKTSTFINTTPDVFVGLFDDATTTAMTNAAISDQLYGADANFRIRAPYFANLSNFDVMVGLRYVALNEKLTASVDSLFSRTFQPALGLPPPVDFSNSSEGSGSFAIRNDFIGPQVGFNAEKHWGSFWAANESKVAVGAMIEHVSVSGSTENGITPTKTIALAGIPLSVNAGAPAVTGIAGGPPSFGLFAQASRSKTALVVVPSGTITLGYDVIPDMPSLTLAYNYLYLSSVGRVGDQIMSPSGIGQSSFFAQGITLGAKALY
jgi:hypothetical protein